VIRPLAILEREAILAALEETNGDAKKASELLGIGKTTLYRRVKEYREQGVIITPPILNHLPQSKPRPTFLHIPSTPFEKEQPKVCCPGCRTLLVVPPIPVPSPWKRVRV
jgi:hypothetical protein